MGPRLHNALITYLLVRSLPWIMEACSLSLELAQLNFEETKKVGRTRRTRGDESILFTELMENPIYQLWECKTCLISILNQFRMFALVYFEMGTCFYIFEPKKNSSKSYIQNTYMENCEAMTSSTHSFAYSYRLFQKCNSKFCVFLIFLSDLHVYWASKETYHFFRATPTKIHAIKFNNIWTQISFNNP